LMLSMAVRDGRLPKNPADGVRLPRAKKAEKRFLSPADVARLATACGEDAIVVWILAYCGLRFGELAALKVSQVDLERRRIGVSEAVTEVAGRLVFGSPKTHQSRSVPIPATIADDLAGHLAGKAPDDYVFTAPEGGILRLRNFRRRTFDPAVATIGMDGLTVHELRHTAASLAVSAGANVKTVQRLLGHASAAMTLDVYSGLFDDDLDAVAERLNESVVPPARPKATSMPTVFPDSAA